MTETKLDRQGLSCRSTQCSGSMSLAGAHVCMHTKNVNKVQRGILSCTLTAKVHCVASSFFFFFNNYLSCCLFSLYIKKKPAHGACCFPPIHRLTVWFMNSMAWSWATLSNGSKWGYFRGKMSCRRVIVAAQPSRVAALPQQLCCGVFSREFPGREGTLQSAATVSNERSLRSV